MRTIFTLLSLLAYLFCMGQEDIRSDWDIQGLNGKARSVRTDGYFLIQDGTGSEKGLPIPGINYHTLDSFNIQGFLLRSVWYNADTIYRMNTRKYLGNLEVETRTFLGTTMVEEIHQEWFSNGELSGLWKLDSQGDTSRHMLNVMDSLGRIVRSYEYAHGALHEKIRFEYDPRGNLTTSTSYDLYDKVILQIDFKYDQLNRMIQMTSWGPVFDQGGWLVDTNMIWEERWSYQDSLLTEYRSLDYNLGEDVRSVFSYSTGDILYKKETYVNGDISELQVWDPKNELIVRHEFYGHGGLRTTEWVFEYSMDEQGNWTNQWMIRDGIPERIIERQIRYF